jgi:FkbM family methyltransferase
MALQSMRDAGDMPVTGVASLMPVPGVAILAAAVARSLPKWTKSRWLALHLFPRLFFRGAVEYRAQLADSEAFVCCTIGSMMEMSVLTLGVWEEDTSAFISRNVGVGQRVLDIGANVGLHTCRLAFLIGESGSVMAFEPNELVRERLQRNLRLNGLRNVSVLSFGLSDAPGTAHLYVNDASSANKNATLVADPRNASSSLATVELRTLDDVWRKEASRRSTHFIKIDIEGYEFAVLRSGAELLKECRPLILAEFSAYYSGLLGYSWRELCTWMEQHGYDVFTLDGTPLSADAIFESEASFNYVATPKLAARPRFLAS